MSRNVVAFVIAAAAALSRDAQPRAASPPQDPSPGSSAATAGEARVGGSRLIKYGGAHPRVDRATSTDWPRQSLDLANGRFSPLGRIDASNVAALTPRWLFQTGVISGYSFETTPVVVGGVMYVTNSQGGVYAIAADTGERLWTFLPGGTSFSTGNRGVAYGNGCVYVAAGTSVFALDAGTGEPLRTFGDNGKADVVADAIASRYPDVSAPNLLGYLFTMAPQYHDGLVIVGTSVGVKNIPSGIIIAADATTGRVVWKFNTVPQGPEDEGWEIAGPTWAGGARNGGGVWGTPSIDPEAGVLYAAVANPSPEHDGSARKGANLFTASVVALDVKTGKLKWYSQQVHHDLWNYDSTSQPILFDVQVRGTTVKALAEPSKNGYLYILDRRTGRPIHGTFETPVPTATDVPGEQPWPTQPIPLKANGQPMEPFVPTSAVGLSPAEQEAAVPYMTPPLAGRMTIRAPGARGGANYGPSSFSPRTGLIYVSGIDDPATLQVSPVGASLQAGEHSTAGISNQTLRPVRGTLSAYSATTGERVWQNALPGWVQAGSVVTAGDLVFAGDSTGIFYGFDARTGKELWRFNTGSGVHSSPIVFALNGEEFVAVGSGGRAISGTPGGDLVVAFALPKARR